MGSVFRSHLEEKRIKSFLDWAEATMHFGDFGFGSLRIGKTTYEHDLIIDRGKIRKRNKKPSKRFREEFGHTPLSIEEEIPWRCRRLVIGTGAYGRLPVMEEVKREAERRKVEPAANAILHVTC